MRIQVTQQHINQGVRGSCSSDPLSLAMKSAGLQRPWASTDHLAWRQEFRDYFAPVPENVLQFMIDFDTNKEVQPFDFEVEA